MYLQGRASEISLWCNDTKQVRNVSASQCVVAHLPPTVILLSVRRARAASRRTAAVICTDAKREYQTPAFSSLTTEAPFFSQLSSNLHARSRRELVPEKEKKMPRRYVHERADVGDVTPRVWSPILECVGVNRQV